MNTKYGYIKLMVSKRIVMGKLKEILGIYNGIPIGHRK